MHITLSKADVVLGLGSNLGDRENYLNQTINQLKKLNILQNITRSSIITSKAMLLPNSPKEWDLEYMNMAIRGTTYLTPDELLKSIKSIEHMMGRNKTSAAWSPREIDIDILAYGYEIINHINLQIPHPELLNRPWAITPFLQIWPEWKHPIFNKTL